MLHSGAHEEAIETAASAIRIFSVDLPDRRDLLSLAMSANARALNELGRPAEAAARQEESLIIMWLPIYQAIRCFSRRDCADSLSISKIRAASTSAPAYSR